MSETTATLPAPVIAPRSELTGYRLVEAKIADLNDTAHRLGDEFNAAYESLDPPAQAHVGAVMDGYHDAQSAAQDNTMRPQSHSEYMVQAGGVPQSLIDKAIEGETVVQAIKAAEAELETHAPEKAAEVLEQARSLEANIDYDKVVASMDYEGAMSSQGHNAGYVIAARKLLESEQLYTFNQLTLIQYYMSQYTERWTEQGILRTDDQQPEVTVDAEARLAALPSSPEELAALQTKFRKAQDIYDAYRRFDPDFHRVPNRLLDDIEVWQRLPDTQEMPDPDDLFYQRDISYNQAFKDAIERSLAERLAALPANDFEMDTDSEAYKALVDAARNIDVDKVLEDLDITGDLEALPFTLTETELKDYLRHTIPPIALAATKRIEFRPLTPEENPDDDTNAFNIFDEETDGYVIVMNSQAIQDDLSLWEEAARNTDANNDIVREFVKEKVLQRLNHEYAHSLHKVLPAATLKQWQQAIAGDPTNVTLYVKHTHDTGHRNNKKEDMADSIGLFVMKPDILRIISNTRFEALRRIYKTFMPGYAKGLQYDQVVKILTLIEVQNSGGISDDEIKQTFLVHETSETPETDVA